jgi:chemotaxis response regulator CheB
MTTKIRVAVCGSSLYMASLAASLQANPDVDVTRIPANTAALSQVLDELAPAVVAFDLDEMPGDLAISLLRDRAELTLIGVDPSSDSMLLLSGRQEQPVSAAELLQAITGDSVGGPLPHLRRIEERAQAINDSQDHSEHGD